MTHEEYVAKQEAALVECLEQLIAGGLGITEGSRKLTSFRHEVSASNDPDFVLFVAIDSETDHYPITENQRGLWDKNRLAQKDQERRRYEERVREQMVEAARQLIRRFKKQWVVEDESLKPRSFAIRADAVAGFYLCVFEDGRCIRDHLQDTFELAVQQAYEDYDVPRHLWQRVHTAPL